MKTECGVRLRAPPLRMTLNRLSSCFLLMVTLLYVLVYRASIFQYTSKSFVGRAMLPSLKASPLVDDLQSKGESLSSQKMDLHYSDFSRIQHHAKDGGTSPSGYFRADVLAKIHNMKPQNVTLGHKLALVGIFCTAADIQRRNLIRHTLFQLRPPQVTVMFVICQPAPSEIDAYLWAEMHDYSDLFLLDCQENMNEGKSYIFFKDVTMWHPDYDFYGKADMDTYILLHNLAILLDALPRERASIGRGALSNGIRFNGGGLYLMSRDLAIRMRTCSVSCQDINGPEDIVIGRLLANLTADAPISYADVGEARGNRMFVTGNSPAVWVYPYSVYVHPVKLVDDWWRVHEAFIQSIDLKAFEKSCQTNFADGPLTTTILTPNKANNK